MSHYDYDMVVIGAGAAGLSAATTAASLGARTLLIEKETALGGECLHYGCIPSKTLIKSASVYHMARTASRFGLTDALMEPPDPRRLKERLFGIIRVIQERESPEWLEKRYGIQTMFGSPKFVDPHVIVLEGKKITSKHFMLATGSRAQIPEIDGLKQVPFMTNREIFYLDRFPKRLAILGGGPNALEVAQTMNRFGVKVFVVEFRHRLLMTEDVDISDLVRRKLEAEGVMFYLNHRILRADSDASSVTLSVEDGESGKQFKLSADSLFVATGRRANVEGLGLNDIGVQYEATHVKIDRELRTSQDNIFAIGDVNGDFMYAHAAISEGQIAVMNAVLHGSSTPKNQKYPYAIYLEPEFASIGYNELRAHAEGIVCEVHIEHFRDNERALIEGESEGFIKILLRKDKPIGVQIFGSQAANLISEWLPVLNGDMTLARVARSMHAYPTQASISQLASGQIVNPKFFDNPVVKWLSSL